ncbi:MAG: hypothetical protein ACREHV_17290, partial [Rhizomicrobium sp.]
MHFFFASDRCGGPEVGCEIVCKEEEDNVLDGDVLPLGETFAGTEPWLLSDILVALLVLLLQDVDDAKREEALGGSVL